MNQNYLQSSYIVPLMENKKNEEKEFNKRLFLSVSLLKWFFQIFRFVWRLTPPRRAQSFNNWSKHYYFCFCPHSEDQTSLTLTRWSRTRRPGQMRCSLMETLVGIITSFNKEMFPSSVNLKHKHMLESQQSMQWNPDKNTEGYNLEERNSLPLVILSVLYTHLKMKQVRWTHDLSQKDFIKSRILMFRIARFISSWPSSSCCCIFLVPTIVKVNISQSFEVLQNLL